MKVLLCHNFYQQPGGEDESYKDEAKLLESHGHQVIRFTRHNDAITHMSRLAISGKTLWNLETYRDLRALIRRERPALMHCTNLFPLISPSVCYAARMEGLSVIQSIRNYRFQCLNAYFLRNGRICEDCAEKRFAWPGIVHRCYRANRSASAVVAASNTLHSLMGTWHKAVTFFFTPSEFTRQKMIQYGFDPHRVKVKPNFVHPDPGLGAGPERYAVFVGRLSPEKGIETLLAAWRRYPGLAPLKIIGDGPLAPMVRDFVQQKEQLEWLGRRPLSEVLSLLDGAVCLVMPSIGYETFGRTIIEAYAKGVPVVASRMGTLPGLVRDGETGFLFQPGNPEDLAAKMTALTTHPHVRTRMGQAARREYEKKYTAEINYRILMDMYEDAINRTI